jgi:hypothetical protein
MNRFLLFFIFVFSNSYAGLFGPSNYAECVLEGLKDATNSTSAQLLDKACTKKYQKEGVKSAVNQCSLTWNGTTFTAGRPDDIEKYTQIVFKGSSDSLFIPDSLMESVTQRFILKEKKKIQSICPSIFLE